LNSKLSLLSLVREASPALALISLSEAAVYQRAHHPSRNEVEALIVIGTANILENNERGSIKAIM
jgi:hypothetical protein